MSICPTGCPERVLLLLVRQRQTHQRPAMQLQQQHQRVVRVALPLRGRRVARAAGLMLLLLLLVVLMAKGFTTLISLWNLQPKGPCLSSHCRWVGPPACLPAQGLLLTALGPRALALSCSCCPVLSVCPACFLHAPLDHHPCTSMQSSFIHAMTAANAVLCCAVLCCGVLQVRKPKRPARLNCLPDLTTAATGSSSAAAAAGGQLAAAAERLNASYHPQLQWPEFGHLLDSLAAAGGGRGRRGGRGAAAAVVLAGPVGGPVPAAVLDWGDAAAAEAADRAQLEQQQQEAGDWEGGVGGDWAGTGTDGYENDYDGGFGDAAAAGADAAGGGLLPWAAAALGGGSGEEGGLPAWMASAGAVRSGQQPEALSYEELCR